MPIVTREGCLLNERLTKKDLIRVYPCPESRLAGKDPWQSNIRCEATLKKISR